MRRFRKQRAWRQEKYEEAFLAPEDTMGRFRGYLEAEAERLTGEIRTRQLNRSPWLELVQGADFPAGLGGVVHRDIMSSNVNRARVIERGAMMENPNYVIGVDPPTHRAGFRMADYAGDFRWVNVEGGPDQEG